MDAYIWSSNAWVISFCFLQVEDAVSRAADGTSGVQDLDFSSLRSQLGSLAAVCFNHMNSRFYYFQGPNKGTINVCIYLAGSSLYWCCCIFCKICKYVSTASGSGKAFLAVILKFALVHWWLSVWHLFSLNLCIYFYFIENDKCGNFFFNFFKKKLF